MKSIGLAAVAVSAFASLATAADLPTRAPAPAPVFTAAYNWSGFYVGANAGAAWASGCEQYFPRDWSDALSEGWRRNCGDNSASFTGGGQIGYNFHSGNLVFGVEADVSGVSSRNGRTLERQEYYFNRISGVGSPNVFGTVRARLGFAADRALFYVTGGLAWADGGRGVVINSWEYREIADLEDPVIVYRRGNSSRVGWALGAGVEYAIATNWTVKAEYLYMNFGNESPSWSCATAPLYTCPYKSFASRNDLSFSVARVGLNYKFGGSPPAPVVARH